ncbi:MAG TPA: ABC transporter ATP-binding protein [bacterium]|nr:ABC transporter ATP-binding protein [bacterium]
MLQTERVRRVYGGLVAIDDVDLAVGGGEIVGLIGPNGAGKTTFFNLVSGAVPVSGGRVVCCGREITHLRPHERAELGIGRTFQIMKPLPRLSVLENVLVGAFLRHPGRREATRWATEVLEFLQLGRVAAQPAGSLTTAGRKRLEVAKALALRPTVLLLDEVVAGLTPTETAEMIALIRRIRDRGITIIMVEHVMRVIMDLSDRVVVLNHGRKIAEGPPGKVAADPEVIRAYLGSRR